MKNSNFNQIVTGSIIIVLLFTDLLSVEEGSPMFDQDQFVANQLSDMCDCGGTGCEPKK